MTMAPGEVGDRMVSEGEKVPGHREKALAHRNSLTAWQLGALGLSVHSILVEAQTFLAYSRCTENKCWF